VQRLRRKFWVRPLAALLVAAFSLSSCATIIHGGGTQTIPITTSPPGATVKVEDQDLITPTEVTLDRNRVYQVTASKTGYQTATKTIHYKFSWVTLLDLIFILPWVIDLVSGGAFQLEPDSLNIVLVPEVPTPTPTPAH
jgi:hypothetical protein